MRENMPKTFTKVKIHPVDMRAIPEESYMLCEQPGCGKEFRIADAFSYPACMALSGPDVHISATCDEGQHFGCSHECALKLHNACIEQHILPKLQAAIAREQQP